MKNEKERKKGKGKNEEKRDIKGKQWGRRRETEREGGRTGRIYCFSINDTRDININL